MVVSYGTSDGLRSREEIMTTETLDKIYLEWSQFTSARTAREIAMLNQVELLRAVLLQCKHGASYDDEFGDVIDAALRADHADLVKP